MCLIGSKRKNNSDALFLKLNKRVAMLLLLFSRRNEPNQTGQSNTKLDNPLSLLVVGRINQTTTKNTIKNRTESGNLWY